MANRPPAVISCTSYPDTVQKDGVGPGTLIPGGSASAMPEVCADDDSKGYTGVRIQPVDSKIRLQLTKKQGLSMRSKANFGNTHIMASQARPINMSIAKLVEGGSSYTEARTQITRATREAHQRFVREGEKELAKEMSFRNLQEKVKNAHTLGSATLTHKIERMHRRGREQQAREMLEWNELNKRTCPFRGQRLKGPKPTIISTSAPTSSLNRSLPLEAGEFLPPRRPQSQSHSNIHGNSTGERNLREHIQSEIEMEGKATDHGIEHMSENGERFRGDMCEEGVKRGDVGEGTRGQLRDNERERDTQDMTFVLRKLYTGGGLDAQQEGWECLPMKLLNTLTMQLGTISKINMPRNSLELLISLRNPNFSCAHMRSVTEINLSGNKLMELPTEAYRLTSLRTLRLDNNKLSGLPEALLTLTSLTSLSLRHNNFSALPYRLGDLRCLQTLDLGENMLKTLPATMGLLTSLQHLKLDGNSMPHLALPPPFKTPDGKDHSLHWTKRWHRERKKEVWVYELTGETSEGDPTSADRRSNSSSSVSSLSIGTIAYNRRRNALATRGVYEWEAALNVSTGQVYYINNVNSNKAAAMPSCMDRLGEMTSLLTLRLSQNKLRSLPDSICACVNMEVLEANDNYLERLPHNLGDMKRLKSIRFDINCLRELPASMVNLSRLEELSLTNNFFATFPEFAMKMSNLKKLLLGNNQLKKLPYSVGFLSNLNTLQLYNNPLSDPPAELLLLGMDKMLWECRKRHWVQTRGLPPVVRVHGYGIEEEKLELQPEFERKMAKCIKTAARTGELNFMMEGLTHFPMGIFDEEIGRKLTSLRLDSNDFSEASVPFRHTWQDLDKVTHSVSLCNLVVLSLKSCKLQRLGDDLAELRSLKELYLENNRVFRLPDTFTRLRTLEILDIRKNRLQDFPPDIGILSRLKRLELDGNRLEVLPTALSELVQLEVLTLSSNHVYCFPNEIVGLEKLRIIDANRNMLTHLPPRFGRLRLRSLKLSFNRLETLRHDLFLPALKGTLKKLWLSNNNLLELPNSIIELSKANEVLMDSNPFKSPPPSLLAEGLSAVVQYIRVRMNRIEVMHQMILKRGFDTSLEFLVPEAWSVLRSDTGYLGPSDLDEFDKAVDRFINGDFYRYPLAAGTILDVVLELRDTRQREFFERMVSHLMARVIFHETREIFSENIFCRHTTRPWGRSKGQVGCFMIAKGALFEDTKPNAFVEELRVCLWSQAKETLPKSVFDYSIKALRKALLSLRSAYGPIARFEDITFDYCECVDVKTGEELRHPRGKCVVPGLVVVKIIYTPEEAERRRAEDKEVTETFEKARKQIWEWLKTKQGHARVTEEIKKRKVARTFKMSLTDAKIAELKGLTEIKKELLAFSTQRKSQFEAGEPFHFHTLTSAEEAIALVADAQNVLTDLQAEIKQLAEENLQLKQELKEKVHDSMSRAEENLVDKYSFIEYEEVLERNRTKALKHGWRRPWDGMDGEEFAEWARNMKCIAATRYERPENVAEYSLLQDRLAQRDWDEAPAELAARLNWKGTEDMDHFLIPRLVELKAKLDKRQSGAPEEDEDEGNDTSDDASALDGKNSTAGSKSEEGGVGETDVDDSDKGDGNNSDSGSSGTEMDDLPELGEKAPSAVVADEAKNK